MGATNDDFDHASPFGRSSGRASNTAGQGRDSGGSFTSPAGGDVTRDGDKVVDQFKGRAKSGSGGGKLNSICNDDDDHYSASDNDGDDSDDWT